MTTAEPTPKFTRADRFDRQSMVTATFPWEELTVGMLRQFVAAVDNATDPDDREEVDGAAVKIDSPSEFTTRIVAQLARTTGTDEREVYL